MSRETSRGRGRRRTAVGLAMAAVMGAVSTLLVAGPASAADGHMSGYVFVTREGLVGGTTANGHIVKPRDHFASLPSRDGLSPKGTGTRPVRVCLRSRCVYEPVWDVGPWNTRDAYWSRPRGRSGLPTGVPEAQAAYRDRYNGGRDEFGRRVSNPSGLDLADGAMWDGLRAGDGAWVTVDFLWTGPGTQGEVRSAGPVNVHSGRSIGSAVVGLAGPYARVPVECQVAGQYVVGKVRSTSLWDRIGPGNYVSDAYVARDPAATLRPC